MKVNQQHVSQQGEVQIQGTPGEVKTISLMSRPFTKHERAKGETSELHRAETRVPPVGAELTRGQTVSKFKPGKYRIIQTEPCHHEVTDIWQKVTDIWQMTDDFWKTGGGEV